MPSRMLVLALCSLPLLACSSSVELDSAGGQTGAGGEGTGGSGGTGGGVGTGGGPTCAQGNETFHFEWTGSDGPGADCSTLNPGDAFSLYFEAVITEATATSIKFATCLPGMPCKPIDNYQLTVTSPGFAMNAMVGGFIQIEADIHFNWHCSRRILVRYLPTLGSQALPNPAGNLETVIFAGSDGVPSAFPDAPFTVGATALGCITPGQSCGGPTPDQYRLDVGGESLVPVYQGETKTVTVLIDGTTPQQVSFRNLRSYETGNCDDYWNYDYWVSNVPHLE